MSDQHSTTLGHEAADADIGPLIKFAIFLALTTFVCAALGVGLYKYLDQREAREKAGRYPLAAGLARPLPPAPRLQNYPFYDLRAFRSEENRVLEHYGWVDKNAGVVRIPVERAIDVLAEQGLPYRSAAPEEPSVPIGQTPRAAQPEGKGAH
jgi:hypothetical protein